MGSFIRRNLAVLLAGLLLIGVSVGFGLTQGAREAAVAEQNALTQSLTQDRDTAQAAVEARALEQSELINGFSPARTALDTTVLTQLMTVAGTWDSAETYIAAREQVARSFGFAENSQFMTTFLPGEAEGAFRRDAADNLHFAFADINSSFDSVTVTPIRVDGVQYTYFARVALASRTPGQQGVAVTRDAAVIFTTDADNKIIDIQAYASDQAPWTTGE